MAVVVPDELDFDQMLVAVFVSSLQSLGDEMGSFAAQDFQGAIESLITLGLVEPVPGGGLRAPAELVELLRADLVREGFPASPTKRAVCITYTVVIQAVTAWENPGNLLLSGKSLPARGSREWLPTIVSAAIASADAALPLVLASKTTDRRRGTTRGLALRSRKKRG